MFVRPAGVKTPVFVCSTASEGEGESRKISQENREKCLTRLMWFDIIENVRRNGAQKPRTLTTEEWRDPQDRETEVSSFK
jgi:hypothetical protein